MIQVSSDLDAEPTVFLGLRNAKHEVSQDPLFAALRLTETLLHRLEQLCELCRRHQLCGVNTQVFEPPIHWDQDENSVLGQATDMTTVWSATPCHLILMLYGRRPKPDQAQSSQLEGDETTPTPSSVELLYTSDPIDVACFRQWAEQGGLIDFFEAGDHDQSFTESFELMVHRRLAELDRRPHPGVLHEIEYPEPEFEPPNTPTPGDSPQ